jgi:hypothetical protein
MVTMGWTPVSRGWPSCSVEGCDLSVKPLGGQACRLVLVVAPGARGPGVTPLKA